ncbi:transcription termination factor MTERF2, chloroplastic [Actinidia eriantha]|uniref:transcription termination factor MTERF2, chloroplastic n=1 Tax=Actinidia eriantha TaxID=165200 RepID=UPI00258472F3|nr:transcription termination factor MTERF2, chloroplastic [Actinidia eriantha]
MLSSRHHYHYHYHYSSHVFSHRHNPIFTTTLHLSTPATRPHLLTITSCSQNHHKTPQSPQPTTTETEISRKHNAKSMALLLRHLSNPQIQQPLQSQEDPSIPQQDKIKLLEMSLVRKKTPQFPGSIYVQSPSDADVNSSLPPLQRLFDGNDDNEEMLMRALEIRRSVTVEIFKEAMRKGKFGITYYTNLISRSPEFVDYVMIKAASMKQLPEYSESTFNVRARTVIDESNVVPLIRWLKHNSLSYPQIAKLICMSRGNLDSIRNVAEWLKSIHVRGRFIGVALTKSGKNVLEHSEEELDEIVGYLESNGVSREWMGYVMSRCPQLMSYSMEELKSRVQFYLDMGMNDKDFGTMVFDFPKVLGHFSMEEMKQKVGYLMEFGLSNEDVGRLLAFKPQLMACSIEERWKPLVKYLYYLGVSKDGMRRILAVKPMIFCVDLESTIVPKVQFLRDIGVREDAIGNMLVKFPPLLTYSLYKKIRPVVIFLLTKAGVTQRDIGKVIALGPELLGCNITHKLDVNVKYFLSLGIPLRSLGEMVADFPMLLRYNIDVLRPKYRYLRRIMVRPLKDLIEFPRFFSYSLEGKIIPRHKIMVENRLNFKLRYMLAGTYEEFDERVRAAVERRQRFELGITDNDPAESQTDDSIESASFDFSIDDCSSSDTQTEENSQRLISSQ